MQRPWMRRLIAGLLLLWLGMLQFPLPLRAPLEKDVSIPFPCMHRACGCASASQCWTSCCCTTKEERIAFAHEHLGYIPKELADSESKPTCTHSCCSKKPVPKPKPKPESSVVVLSQALECKGIPAGWSIFTVAVPAPIAPAIVTTRTEPEQPIVAVDATVESPVVEPLTPPPRSLSCATASA